MSVSLMAAMGLHLLVLWWSKGPTEKPTVHLPLQVRVVTSAPDVLTKPAVKKIKRGPTSKGIQESESPRATHKDATSGYAALFPKSWSPVSDDSSMENATQDFFDERGGLFKGERKPPEVQRRVDRIASMIDIPLEWRKLAKAGRAVVVVYLNEKNEIWLRSLYGDPLLRAALYKSLTRVETLSYLRDALTEATQKDLKIVLRFIPEPETTTVLNTEARAYEDGLLVTKRLPAPIRQFQGMSLEDEHSKRAKEKDRLEWNKLMATPAFAYPLQERPLKM